MCFPVEYVFFQWNISLGICVSWVGEHISLVECVSWVGEHISQVICVFQVDQEEISLRIVPVRGNTYLMGEHIMKSQ